MFSLVTGRSSGYKSSAMSNFQVFTFGDLAIPGATPEKLKVVRSSYSF